MSIFKIPFQNLNVETFLNGTFIMPYKIDGYFKDKIEDIFVLSSKTITIYSTYVRSHSRFSQTYKTGIFASKGLHFGKDFLNFN